MSEPRNVFTKEAESTAIGAGLAIMPGTLKRQVKLPSAQNAYCEGISALAAAAAGDAFPVIMAGPARAILGYAATRGDYLMAYDTAGGLGPIGAVSGTNYNAIALALESGDAAAEIDVFVIHTVIQAA
ncbi:MAG TPA: hypothetical protein VMX97_03310 [Hyphomicrobiaceae bacterium]|nr:hypothetical protein [Hyphomicrobiaceae bacterium]